MTNGEKEMQIASAAREKHRKKINDSFVHYFVLNAIAMLTTLNSSYQRLFVVVVVVSLCFIFFSQTEMFAAAVGICSGKDEWPHGEPLTMHIQHINITEKLKRIVSRTNTSVEKKHRSSDCCSFCSQEFDAEEYKLYAICVSLIFFSWKTDCKISIWLRPRTKSTIL